MSIKLRCLIVDDEPIARQIVEKYCSYFEDIAVVASCGDALQAKQVLSREEVDILFLDINMPVLDGLALVKTLRKPLQIIFTTAYKEYAHEAFDINACDYLLKPFSLERFIQAVDKAKVQLVAAASGVSTGGAPLATDLYIKSDGKILKFSGGEILYAEAQGNNVKIVTGRGTFPTTITFSAFEEQLPKVEFVRVHRSFIINKSKIRIIEGNRIFIESFEIPIGANYRESFMKAIGMK
ncbi:LytTR family DNA-binding domain-containing protein [Chryseolinea sp. T2]|uniref:LytR/AlgR family response regulator transcription factor n=1 Tax=Chryseolinea sp. T2 TaxID=3129255 RepID=UPI0030768A60